MFALGTAQLGQTYGLTNLTGPPDEQEILSLISTAASHKILTFDTAQAYGESETLLGRALASLDLLKEAKVISKTSITAQTTPAQLRKSIQTSLSHLKVPTLEGLLIHNDAQYPGEVIPLQATLEECIEEGLIRHWGLSTYSPQKAAHLLTETSGSLLQVPANILDRRFTRAGVASLAKQNQKQLYIRSLFLQGLLLQSPDQLPEKAPPLSDALRHLQNFCQQHQLDQATFVYRYIRDSGWGIPVIGAETSEQLRQNLQLEATTPLPPGLSETWDESWPDDHLRLIDPRYW